MSTSAPPPVLELSGASLVRGDAQVLHRISLSVRAGEHTAILGPNGSGKSSLIRLLTLQDHPLASAAHPDPVRWFGRARLELGELMRRVGVISGEVDAGFAQASARGRVTALDAVVSGFHGSQGRFAHQTVTEAQVGQALAALARVGLGTATGRFFSTMSAGERRRVLIARMLVINPAVVLLDEPTAGLDLVARHEFLAAVRQLCRSGTTAIVVTHDVDEVVPEIGRVVLLNAGRVVADGPRAMVLTSEGLSQLFGREIKITGAFGHSRAHLVTPPSPLLE